ncbi:hypothetical protein [Anaerorhabdus sp.]|jgi:hypothetical protein|uniref:hypothetical protein n=1 Tax=Anaerorhabdus sp. TaxID=1872524 RepID=UPI002FC94E46
MIILNYFIIIVALLCCCTILYFVITRNKKVLVKGFDDFFTVIIILFFTMLIFPINVNTTILESARNSILYITIFSTFAIRRGISQNGFEKFCYTIPWSKITEIRLVPYQINKIHVEIITKDRTYKLIFREYLIPKILNNISSYVKNIKIEQSIQVKIEKGMFKKVV